MHPDKRNRRHRLERRKEAIKRPCAKELHGPGKAAPHVREVGLTIATSPGTEEKAVLVDQVHFRK